MRSMPDPEVDVIIPGHVHTGSRYQDGTCDTCDWCQRCDTYTEWNSDEECTECGRTWGEPDE